METITLNVNGIDHSLEVRSNWTLIHVLREVLNLKGTKFGCGTGDCGACKVLVDGVAVNSCTLLVKKLTGKKIITIEGISEGCDMHPVQQAFIDSGAVQCGFCTPGMIIRTIALLQENPSPSRDEIISALDNNICRCTGYKKIIEAIELSAERMREEI